ncbi:MAG: biopolymer transporter ExbD [Phycisphaerae bacterium]
MSHGQNNSLHVGPNMTPMVDIVMCILIFFMLGSSFAIQEWYLNHVPAVLFSGGSPKLDKLPALQTRIVLRRVGASTKVSAFGSTLEGIDSLSPTAGGRAQVDDIRDLLVSKRAQLNRDVQIIVAPERNVPYQDVITIYSLCLKAQYEKVTFAALR